MKNTSKRLRTMLICIGIFVIAIALIWALVTFSLNHLVVSTDPVEAIGSEEIAAMAKEGKPGNNVSIGGTEIDYSPGEYGYVKKEPIETDFFSSEEAVEEYESHWHDRSWKGELPSNKRCRIAYFELDPDFRWVDGELLVIFKKEVSRQQIVTAAESASLAVESIQALDENNNVALFYTYRNPFDPLEEADSLQNSCNYIEAAFPNLIGKADGTVVNDPLLTLQTYIPLSKFNEAWEDGASGENAVVAVLDSGIEAVHLDLYKNIDYEHAYDGIENEKLSNRFTDSCGHGTIVSGIVSARTNNNEGIAGCSRNAAILPMRVAETEDDIPLSAVSNCLTQLLALDQKPAVINMSFGFTSDGWSQAVDGIVMGWLLQGNIDELSERHGVVCVASCGNEGMKGSPLSYPAGLDNVIGVGAVTEQKTKAYFSSANKTVDICALGTEVYSTVSFASEFSNMNRQYANAYWKNPDSEEKAKVYIQGTSFAAPQVAAAAAMLRAQHPSWTAKQIEDRLESTAVDLGVAGRDDRYGYGLLDAAAACTEKQSTESGSGTGTGADSGKSPALGGSIAEAYRQMKDE